jgi:hypothetical protein
MKRFLVYLLLLAPLLGAAQTNFQPGFVVKNNGDTLKGFINYKERSTTPKSLNFKQTINGKSQLYATRDILSYTINDKASYERFIVNISMSEVNIGRLSIGLDTSSRRDTVLLQVLQKGKNVNLYAYSDDIKVRFYIKETPDQEPVELIQKVFMLANGSNSMFVGKEYLKQIETLLKKHVSTEQFSKYQLSRLRYTAKELGEPVMLINDQKVKKAIHAATRFFVGVGLNYSTSKYVGDNDLANAAAKNSSSSLPMFSGGVDIYANPAIQRLVYRVELSLYTSKNNISTVTENIARAVQKHTFDQQTIQLMPQVLFNFYNKEKIKLYLGGGFGVNYYKYKNNVTSITNTFRNETEDNVDYVDFEELSFAVQVSAGLVVNKRFEFYGKFSPQTAITNYTYYNIVMQRVGLGVNFLFGKP